MVVAPVCGSPAYLPPSRYRFTERGRIFVSRQREPLGA